MEFIYDRLKDKNPDGSIQIMYTIHGRLVSLNNRGPSDDFLSLKGEKIFPEKELTHLDGHKGSKPVRIGNGAIDHVQLVGRHLHLTQRVDITTFQDIYGELYGGPMFPWGVRNLSILL
jgi:GH15 family glucan-1,4-alpha-glucosidase